MLENKRVITTPLTEEEIKDLKAGDSIYINGIIYTGRDAAHQRMVETIRKGERLPFNIENQVIYYVGPTPPRPGQVIGAAGPTTSYRMDDLTVELLELGLKGMIGKGNRSTNVIEAMKKHKAIYFAAIGGAGALISDTIKKAEVVAYEDLGTEAIRKLRVVDLPVVVVIDSHGNNLYEIERKKYQKGELNGL